MFNQFNQNFGFYPQAGMQYNQMPTAKMTQVLTPEQIKQLRTTSSQFSLQVDPIEITRSLCTHKDNGKIAVLDNGDGTVTCSVCGARFKLVDWETTQVQEATNMFLDILQSIKTYYLDIPESYVTEYFKMIPLLEKVPKFFELALHNFRKYEQGNPYQQGRNMYGFNMLNAITGPSMGMGMGVNPTMMNTGMGMGAPMYQPQPAGFGVNPFVSGGYTPVTPVQQPAQPAQPAQSTEQAQSGAQSTNQNQTVQTTKMFNL